jgi:hypothetical protein
LAGAVNGGFADAEASRDPGFGVPLEKPPSDKLFLGFVEFGWAPGRGLVQQAVEAMLLVVSFPAALGSNRVAEGTSQVHLGCQFALPKHDTDIAEVWQVVESDPIDRLVAAEDDAITVASDKPQAWGDESAGVGRRRRRKRQQRFSACSTHTDLDV